MDWRVFAAAVLVLGPSLTVGGGIFTALQPEEVPDPQPPAYADLDIEGSSSAGTGASSVGERPSGRVVKNDAGSVTPP